MHKAKFDISGLSVHVGVPAGEVMSTFTSLCLIDLACLFQSKGLRFEIKIEISSCYVERARNFVADNFLKSGCDRLLMIDSDMVFKPADVVRLLALSTVLDVVSAAYTIRGEPCTYIVSMPEKVSHNEFGCMPHGGMGLGFTVVSRQAMQTLADVAPLTTFAERPKPIPAIFRNSVNNGVFTGEDMNFFADLRTNGYQPWVDPLIDLGHRGFKEYRGNFREAIAAYERQQRKPCPAADCQPVEVVPLGAY